MTRRMMDWLSYGFYFIIFVLIVLGAYFLFFRNTNSKDESNIDNTIVNTTVKNENIKLNSSNISLDIGGSFDLNVTLLPSSGNEIVEYTSANMSIASVDEFGKISGISAGTTTITAHIKDTDLKAECSVTVSSNIISVTNIFSSSSKININVNDTYQLDITVIPKNAVNQNLIYSVEDNEVASVDSNGLVKGLKKGRTVVIIKSAQKPDIQTEVSVIVK